jgi:type IV secretory pathway VirB4 component
VRARKQIASRRRHYHNTKTSFLSNLEEKKNQGPKDELVDDSKQAAIDELGECLKAIGNEGKYFGEFTLSLVVYDKDPVRVEEAITELQRVFTTHDALLYEERYNLLNAFFATVPGNSAFNLRKQQMLNTNYADLSFLFTVDQGKQWNEHWFPELKSQASPCRTRHALGKSHSNGAFSNDRVYHKLPLSVWHTVVGGRRQRASPHFL